MKNLEQKPSRPTYFSKKGFPFIDAFYMIQTKEGYYSIMGIHNDKNLAQFYGVWKEFTIAEIVQQELDSEFEVLKLVEFP
jgi:hypothetical protein